MKTLQEQYNLIKEGKGHKDVFLKEAKSRYPNMISNVLTYDQATTILKQRSIIQEHFLGGVAQNMGKKPDWFNIFDEKMNIISEEELNKNDYAFGQEGIGYKEDTPGLKPTEIKGKYAESGYGDETKKEANDKFVEVKESKISFNDLLND